MGPALARALHRLGVHTYRSIGEWTDADVERMEVTLPDCVGRISGEGWVAGARTCWTAAYGRPWAERADVVDGPVPDWARRLEREGPLPLLARARRDGGNSVRPGRLGGGDDLQRIAGVDARIEVALQRAGLTSWVRVAAASPVQIRAALASGGLGPVPGMEEWPVEAGHLAAGDEAGLADFRRSRSAAVGPS